MTDDIKPTQHELKSQISKTLSKRRQERKLSYENISQALKLRVPLLKSIDTGEWDNIPGGVYLKGFLMKYARFLGLDAEKLINPYFNGRDKKNVLHVDNEPPTESHDKMTRVWWVVGGLGIVMFMGLVKFLVMDASQSNPVPVVTPEPPVQERLAPQPAEEEVVSIEQHTLTVYSPNPLWLSIQAQTDNFEGFVPQGATWTWTGGGPFLVKLGHTKEVAMAFDGNSIPLTENKRRLELPHVN